MQRNSHEKPIENRQNLNIKEIMMYVVKANYGHVHQIMSFQASLSPIQFCRIFNCGFIREENKPYILMFLLVFGECFIKIKISNIFRHFCD
jgi:hypothetical protein